MRGHLLSWGGGGNWSFEVIICERAMRPGWWGSRKGEGVPFHICLYYFPLLCNKMGEGCVCPMAPSITMPVFVMVIIEDAIREGSVERI